MADTRRELRRRLCGLAAALLASSASAADPAVWTITARLQTEPARLQLQACSDRPATRQRFTVRRGAEAYLVKAERSHASPLRQRNDWLIAEDWQAGECLHTVIDLAAATAADRYGLGGRAGAFWRLPPDRWLWQPWQIDPDSRIRFELPQGWSVSVPWTPQPDGSYRLGATTPNWPAQVVWGRFDEHTLRLPGGQLRLAIVPTADTVAAAEPALRRWMGEVAQVLLTSQGRLPVPDAQVLLLPLPGQRSPVPWGQVTRGGGSAVQLFVGLDAGYAAWSADWTASHEFAHLQHPYLGDDGRWLAEGLASYHQNVLRARAGELTPAEAWRRLRAGFERGRRATPTDAEPLQQVSAARQRGSTMRVYWAGAAFWLETDLALRAEGGSLDRLLAAFARRHLPSEEDWRAADFAATLHKLAPEVGILPRYWRYAEARDFPDTEALLAQAGADSSPTQLAADSALARILAPQSPRPAQP